MHDPHLEFEHLDRLMNSHPPPAAPEGFPELVMRSLHDRSQRMPIWQHPVVQWLAAGVGLWFTLGRLLGYIFSAWFSIQLAG
ncbi:MAG: hypothetical protein PVG22_16730 [Chromatiales bacterium]|jgi:hypothetical protein